MWYVDYNVETPDGDDCIPCPTWNDVLNQLRQLPENGCNIYWRFDD